MPNYRRAFVPGGCWFFTVNLLDRRRQLLTDQIDALREATRLTHTRHPFTIDAMVVLPDHIHAVWTLPPGDADFSLRWRLIKIDFAKAVPNTELRSAVRLARGERAIWQPRFWEHLIRDDEDFRRHVEYCYINPVKARLGHQRPRLAAFVVPSRRAGGAVSRGLGGRCLGGRRLWRACLRWCGAMRYAYCALRHDCTGSMRVTSCATFSSASLPPRRRGSGDFLAHAMSFISPPPHRTYGRRQPAEARRWPHNRLPALTAASRGTVHLQTLVHRAAERC
jgi:putative transposase